MYMSQDDDVTRGSGTVMLPRDPNLKLSGDYPVVTDPDDANKDCSVEEAVYRNVEDACYDSNGDPMTGLNRSCGMGTTKRILDMDTSVGFVAAQGTGTCDIIQDDEGVCEVPCPADCEGGTWSTGTCLRMNEDGEEVALFDGGKLSEGTCGPGQVTRVRRRTGDFKPAVGTGSCTFFKQEPCFKTCTDDQGNEIDAQFVGVCGYSGIETLDRDIGSKVFGHEGCVKIDENDEPVKDEDGNYIPVGEGEEGRARWYQPVVYGDSTKCKNLVSWKQCRGPDVPTDCVGGWKNQGTCENDTRNIIPDGEDEAELTCDPKWSACYLRRNPLTGLTPTHGKTYRYKEYHISQPASEALPGGGRAGKACFAEVELEGGKKEKRQFDSDDTMVFEQECPPEQHVPKCVKKQWVLDTTKGADTGYCRLDENGENPTKRYTREVKGACGPEWETKSDRYFDEPYDPDDPDGNDEEKFVGCCYKTDWVDAESNLVDTTNGTKKQTRIVKNCTGGEDGDPDGTSWERHVNVCYIPEWTDDHKDGECGEHDRWGQQKYVRDVKNASLCRAEGREADSEKYEPCCQQTEWEQGATCQSDGHYKETRSVSTACEELGGEDAATTRKGAECCYIDKSGGTEPIGDGTCGSNGVRTLQWKEIVGTCSDAEKRAGTEDCCYIPKDSEGNEIWGEAQPKEGATCSDDGNLEVVKRRTLVGGGNTCDGVDTEWTGTIACKNCKGEWEGVEYTYHDDAQRRDEFGTTYGVKKWHNHKAWYRFNVTDPADNWGEACPYKHGEEQSIRLGACQECNRRTTWLSSYQDPCCPGTGSGGAYGGDPIPP